MAKKTKTAGPPPAVNIPPKLPDAVAPKTNELSVRPPWLFKPGVSGNPSGRPKSTHMMKVLFAGLTDTAYNIVRLKAEVEKAKLDRALDILADDASTAEDIKIALDMVGSVGLDTVNVILDRGHGKPQQKVEVDHRHVFDELDDDEREAWMIDLGSRVMKDIQTRREQKAIESDVQRTRPEAAKPPRKA